MKSAPPAPRGVVIVTQTQDVIPQKRIQFYWQTKETLVKVTDLSVRYSLHAFPQMLRNEKTVTNGKKLGRWRGKKDDDTYKQTEL